jgi:hypothetical protein
MVAAGSGITGSRPPWPRVIHRMAKTIAAAMNIASNTYYSGLIHFLNQSSFLRFSV